MAKWTLINSRKLKNYFVLLTFSISLKDLKGDKNKADIFNFELSFGTSEVESVYFIVFSENVKCSVVRSDGVRWYLHSRSGHVPAYCMYTHIKLDTTSINWPSNVWEGYTKRDHDNLALYTFICRHIYTIGLDNEDILWYYTP